MKIALGADHAGYELKEKIKEYLEESAEHQGLDYGTYDRESVDYPDFAARVAWAVYRGECQRGIAICGTGVGVAITANKFPGVRASLCTDNYTVRMARLHNNLNVLTLGARSVGEGLALDLVLTFLNTPFEGGRHQRRLDKIEAIQQSNCKNRHDS